MTMNNLVDRYVLKARVAPVAVVSLPLALAIGAWIPFSEWPIKLFGGSAVLTLAAFVLAELARDAGKAIEAPLWASWGGPPTVRMLRHRDATIAPGSKAIIHRHLVDLGIVDYLPTPEEETRDPAGADALYLTCSDWLRRKALELKAQAPFDIVHSENISYGFRRNILGIKPYGLATVAGALVITFAAFVLGRTPLIELGLILGLGLYLVAAVTAAAVKRVADEYSKRLLDASQAIPLPTAKRRKNAIERKDAAE
jgi:hypothetical protein